MRATYLQTIDSRITPAQIRAKLGKPDLERPKRRWNPRKALESLLIVASGAALGWMFCTF